MSHWLRPEHKCASRSPDCGLGPRHTREAQIGVSAGFEYDEHFDRARVVAIGENARETLEGLPGLRSEVFTVDDARQRAMNFYVSGSADARKSCFSEEKRERVTRLYCAHKLRRVCLLDPDYKSASAKVGVTYG